MKNKTCLVVTSIASPNDVLMKLAMGSAKNNIEFIVIGDTSSPAKFHLPGCNFFSLKTQKKLDFHFAQIAPEKKYSRKNIGYLIAIKNGAELIIETDDDNYPEDAFWDERTDRHTVSVAENSDWINIYKYFSDGFIWPRGFPLELLNNKFPEPNDLKKQQVYCPILQGLADQNPDVDAVFRLTRPLPFHFNYSTRVAVGKKTWAPFNSQNTTFFKEAFPLMYLPTYCSFRMTDIWRSFVAQRICWENNWYILFHEPTVWQERNEHNFLKDFEDEIPGYLNNYKISRILETLELEKGVDKIADNLYKCYTALIHEGFVGKEELNLLNAWLSDCRTML